MAILLTIKFNFSHFQPTCAQKIKMQYNKFRHSIEAANKFAEALGINKTLTTFYFTHNGDKASTFSTTYKIRFLLFSFLLLQNCESIIEERLRENKKISEQRLKVKTTEVND